MPAVVVDHFHAIRLANLVVDQVRRRVQQATLGHRGRKRDPLYGHLYDEADVALRERLEAMFVPVVALPRDSCGPGEHTAPSEAPSPTEEIRPDLGERRVGLAGLEPETSSL
jgi:hypothetical protein